MLSPIIGLGLASAAILLVVAALASVPIERRVSRRPVRCPVAGRDVTVDRQHLPGGAPIGVERCTAFRPHDAVTCQQVCLRFELSSASDVVARAA